MYLPIYIYIIYRHTYIQYIIIYILYIIYIIYNIYNIYIYQSYPYHTFLFVSGSSCGSSPQNQTVTRSFGKIEVGMGNGRALYRCHRCLGLSLLRCVEQNCTWLILSEAQMAGRFFGQG